MIEKLEQALSSGYLRSIGTLLIEKSKSPFVTDEILARWIDVEVNLAREVGTRLEHDRIEAFIAKMTEEEVVRMVQNLREKYDRSKEN